MYTYQNLLDVPENEKGDFCRSAVNEFMASKDYKIAKDGQSYYDKHNTTIEKYQKYLYSP